MIQIGKCRCGERLGTGLREKPIYWSLVFAKSVAMKRFCHDFFFPTSPSSIPKDYIGHTGIQNSAADLEYITAVPLTLGTELVTI